MRKKEYTLLSKIIDAEYVSLHSKLNVNFHYYDRKILDLEKNLALTDTKGISKCSIF